LKHRIVWTVAAALCALAAPGALAQTAAPATAGPSAAGPQAPAPVAAPQWPRLLPDQAAAAVPAAWSQREVEAAQAHCAIVLKGLNVVATPEAPVREGTECGTPAPMRLMSVGRSPQVALSPPPTLTCDMVAAVARWLERDVQPLARKHLGAPVARIETMSSYSCRNAYGRAQGRVSEHGKANALDIGSFVTTRGGAAMVIADWGPTARDIAAAANAAKREAEAKPGKTVPPAPAQAPREGERSSIAARKPPAAVAATIAPLDLRPGALIGVPGITVDIPRGQGNVPVFGLAQPSRLGGPKPPPDQAWTPTVAPDGKTDFLRAVHRSACKAFKTALGPEANNAHLNHFHIDLAERVRDTKVCD
jgi:hypothetical protein